MKVDDIEALAAAGRVKTAEQRKGKRNEMV